MDKDKTSEKHIETIKLTLGGELVEGGSIHYKTLVDVLEGTVGALEGMTLVVKHKGLIDFNVRPPKEKCFEISLDVVEWLGATVPFIGQSGSIQDIIKIFLDYIKIKKGLKGEKIKPANFQKNERGDTVIKDNSGKIIIQDNSINVNLMLNVQNDSRVNKKIDRVAKAIEDNKRVDSLSYSKDLDKPVNIPRAEAEYLRYQEVIEQKPDTVVGFIRKIDNKVFKGVLVVDDDGRNKNVDFELDIKDLKLLDKIVSNLAYAEADKVRVIMAGEKIYGSGNKLKKVIVNDVDIPDSRFDI